METQQEIYELVKEIIPQIQARIKGQLREQYEKKFRQMQDQYQAQIERILEEKHFQLKSICSHESSREELELCKRVRMLECQRKNWCKMQAQYEKVLREMSHKIAQYENNTKASVKGSQDVVTPLAVKKWNEKGLQQKQAATKPMKQVSEKITPKQQGLPEKITPKQIPQTRPFPRKERNDTQFSDISSIHPPPSAQMLASEPLHIDKLDEDSSSCSGFNKYLREQTSKDEHQSEEESAREEEDLKHYKSVLSPPKSSSNDTIFWNQEKKKHLLNLIKLK